MQLLCFFSVLLVVELYVGRVRCVLLQQSRGVSAFFPAIRWMCGARGCLVLAMRRGRETRGGGRSRARLMADLEPRSLCDCPARFTGVRVSDQRAYTARPPSGRMDRAPYIELTHSTHNQKYIRPRFLYNFRVLLLREDRLSAAGHSRTTR